MGLHTVYPFTYCNDSTVTDSFGNDELAHSEYTLVTLLKDVNLDT